MLTLDTYGSNKSTTLQLPPFGEVVLKYVSVGDLDEFFKLQKEESDEKFVRQLLGHQLKSPESLRQQWKSLTDAQLAAVGKAFIAKNDDMFEAYLDTGNFYGDFRLAINACLDKHMQRMTEFIKPLITPANEILKACAQIGEQTSRIMEGFKRSVSALPDFGKLFKDIDKAGLPHNWGDNRSHRELSKMEGLLQEGIPIIWVPRREVIDKLLAASSLRARKQVLAREEQTIFQDCITVLDTVQGKELVSAKELVLEAMDTVNNCKAYRSAQCSAATACDVLFGYMLGKKVSHDHQMKIHKPVRTRSQTLTSNYDNIPITYLYAALAVQPVAVALQQFDRSKPSLVPHMFNRHATAHSLSDRQHKKSNAIIAIMLATTLIKTTDECGRGWLYELANI